MAKNIKTCIDQQIKNKDETMNQNEMLKTITFNPNQQQLQLKSIVATYYERTHNDSS